MAVRGELVKGQAYLGAGVGACGRRAVVEPGLHMVLPAMVLCV